MPTLFFSRHVEKVPVFLRALFCLKQKNSTTYGPVYRSLTLFSLGNNISQQHLNWVIYPIWDFRMNTCLHLCLEEQGKKIYLCPRGNMLPEKHMRVHMSNIYSLSSEEGEISTANMWSPMCFPYWHTSLIVK